MRILSHCSLHGRLDSNHTSVIHIYHTNNNASRRGYSHAYTEVVFPVPDTIRIRVATSVPNRHHKNSALCFCRCKALSSEIVSSLSESFPASMHLLITGRAEDAVLNRLRGTIQMSYSKHFHGINSGIMAPIKLVWVSVFMCSMRLL